MNKKKSVIRLQMEEDLIRGIKCADLFLITEDMVTPLAPSMRFSARSKMALWLIRNGIYGINFRVTETHYEFGIRTHKDTHEIVQVAKLSNITGNKRSIKDCVPFILTSIIDNDYYKETIEDKVDTAELVYS